VRHRGLGSDPLDDEPELDDEDWWDAVGLPHGCSAWSRRPGEDFMRCHEHDLAIGEH
jgi:hypothetical protein